jgi:hypothetical protein
MMSFTAPPSSSSTTAIASTLSIPISKKLTKMNYPLWRAQVLPAICVVQFEDLLTGDDSTSYKHLVVTDADKSISSTPNPAYISWVA